MHPVQARHVVGLQTSKQILLLNTAVIWLERLRLNPQRIQGPTGTVALPPELWMRVLHFIDGGVAPTFVAVTVESSAPANDGAQRVDLLERRLDVYTDIEGEVQIGRFEEFLKRPPAATPLAPAAQGEVYVYDEEDYDGNYVKLSFTLPDVTFPEARTFSIVIPDKYSQDRLHARTALDLLPVAVALFFNINFTDCHARLGWDARLGCSMCYGSRFICPGCTRGRAQRYDAFMGCGVDLACPHCLGLRTCWDDKRFLQVNYWESPSVEDERDRRAGLVHRLKELGYATGRGWVFTDPALEKEEYESTTDSNELTLPVMANSR